MREPKNIQLPVLYDPSAVLRRKRKPGGEHYKHVYDRKAEARENGETWNREAHMFMVECNVAEQTAATRSWQGLSADGQMRQSR